MRLWLMALLLAAVLPLSTSDVEVLRADGSGRVATVVQDSAVGWDTTIYPHCVFVDNPQFVAIDTDSSQTLSRAELDNDGAGNLMHTMDRNDDDLVDVLEFASGADSYLALKSIDAGGAPNPNISCATCASGWMGQHCSEEMVPVQIKIAVRASQAYFSAQKQEALRRALALGVQWNQVRVVVKSVVTTETEGQLMHAELLAGGTPGRGDPKTAAVFLANAGSNFHQETLWESLWYLHVVCPTNCTVRVEGDTRTWRSPISARCTGPANQRIYALGRQDCENTRNDNSWLPAEVSRCEDRSAACKTADGTAVTPQPANIGACLDVEGQSWEPTIVSSDGTQAACTTQTTYDWVAPVQGLCFICKDANGLPVDPPEETADMDGIIRYKRDCEAVTGQTWELIASRTTEQTCEWVPRDNEWRPAVEAGCFSGEVQHPQYAVNITTEKECVTAFNTGSCDGRRGECNCAIGYQGVDCTTPILTPAEPETPQDPFWKIVLYLAGVTVAAPASCALTITVWRKCSHPLMQVAPDNEKKDPRLFMPREMKVAGAHGVDVLDMTVLQPIAPAGAVAIGGQKNRGVDAEEGVLQRFERERKHISINRKVGAQFDLGFPT